MSVLRLAWAYVRYRALNSVLNVMLMSFGVATVTVLLLLSVQLEDQLFRNARGIDMVVGAKGSPIQLILSGIYHLDSPTGNIPLDEARDLMSNRWVKDAYPLALGDSWKGYRIVGTTSAYLDLHEGSYAKGSPWDRRFEVVLGGVVAAETGASIGDELVSSHGLSEGGAAHVDHAMRVVGILSPNGSVLDQLVLSSVETMWGIHEYDTAPVEATREAGQTDADRNADLEHEHDHDNGQDAGHDHGAGHGQDADIVDDESYLDPAHDGKEITALLINYANPLAAAQLPRYVNTQTDMQAAVPAFEISRLMSILGVGFDAIRVFGFILMFSSALGLLIALLNSMKERAYDLAIMRSLGGSRWTLVSIVLSEALMLSLAGGILGIALGHIALEWIGDGLADGRLLPVTGGLFLFSEIYILTGVVAIGGFAALFPAVIAYRTDVHDTLTRG